MSPIKRICPEPELRPTHSRPPLLAAGLDDCVTRCRSYHGSKDAPRARRRRNTRSPDS